MALVLLTPKLDILRAFASLLTAKFRLLSCWLTTGDAVGYTCYLAAPGVIRTGSQFPLSIKQNDDILSLQDVMSVTYNRLDHVLGTSYKGDMHPENSDLADESNWELAYTSRENVPLVELIVNTPYGQPSPD